MGIMAITMKDIAERAGVSKSTISQYLNGNYEFMSEATRKKVAATIKEMDYRPNQIARSLRKKKTNIIAILAANITSRFTTDIASIVEKKVSPLGYDVILSSSTNDDPKKEKKYVETLISRQMDGIIVIPSIENTDLYTGLINQGFPVVFFDRYLPEHPDNTIILNNNLATKLAVDELAAHGHKRIALMTLPSNEDNPIPTRIERLQGYKKAMEANELAIDEGLIQAVPLEDIPESLSRLTTFVDPPTAVIAINDMVLEATLKWINDNAISIPEDLSIISIDDPSFAGFYPSPITTVKQPIEDMANEIADLIIKKIEDRNFSKPITRKDPILIRRKSVKTIN